MIKYQVFLDQIREVEILKETPQTVTLKNGEVRHKITSLYRYYDTWEKAHGYLLNKIITNIEEIEQRLKYANEVYNRVKGMKNETSKKNIY